jgi:transmembrane sensor
MHKNIDYIIKKGKEDNASELEKKEMLALFHQAENEYELKGNLLEDLQNTETKDITPPPPYFKKLFARLWSKIENTKSKPISKVKILQTFSKIAAAVVIGLFLGMYINSVRSKKHPVYYSAHSPKGSISEMILPDSSIIFLNADSRIKYSVDGEKGIREVFLDGEAWFDVNKKKKKPFIVHTTYYDIHVTGTQFNVKSYESDNKIFTTLEEGQIIINSTDKCKLAENIVLKPGEQIVLDKETKQIAIKTVNTQWFTSWKENKLIFVNMGLKELIVLLERKYGVDIEVNNNALLDLHFDGTIKNETIIEILEIIKKTLPVNYKITDQKINITAK